MTKEGTMVLIFGAAAVALYFLFAAKPTLARTSAFIPSGGPTGAYPYGVPSAPALFSGGPGSPPSSYVMNPSPVSAYPRSSTPSSLPSLITSLLGGGSRVVTASTPYQQPPQVGSASYTYLTTPTAYANVLQNSNTAFTQATLDPTYMQDPTGGLVMPVDSSIGSLDLSAASDPIISDASVCYTCS